MLLVIILLNHWGIQRQVLAPDHAMHFELKQITKVNTLVSLNFIFFIYRHKESHTIA